MKVSGFFHRFFCLLTVCVLLVPAAFAGTVDLSAMSDAEIISLLNEVNTELVNRGINRTATLPKGAYIAGKDLPAGRYIFTSLATGDDWGNVTVYSEGGKGRQLLWEIVSSPDEGEDPDTIFITLSDGDELKSGVPFSLTIMSGAVFR